MDNFQEVMLVASKFCIKVNYQYQMQARMTLTIPQGPNACSQLLLIDVNY